MTWLYGGINELLIKFSQVTSSSFDSDIPFIGGEDPLVGDLDFVADIKKLPKGIINDKTGKHYELEFAVVAIWSSTSEIGHAVTGFICDGVFKVFDSNGFVYTLDWTELNEEKFKILAEPYDDFQQGQYRICIRCALYLEREYKKQFTKNITELCMELD